MGRGRGGGGGRGYVSEVHVPEIAVALANNGDVVRQQLRTVLGQRVAGIPRGGAKKIPQDGADSRRGYRGLRGARGAINGDDGEPFCQWVGKGVAKEAGREGLPSVPGWLQGVGAGGRKYGHAGRGGGVAPHWPLPPNTWTI